MTKGKSRGEQDTSQVRQSKMGKQDKGVEVVATEQGYYKMQFFNSGDRFFVPKDYKGKWFKRVA